MQYRCAKHGHGVRSEPCCSDTQPSILQMTKAGSDNQPHQNLDLAETSFVAHSFMRNSGGSGSESVGEWRPTT
jgi:hypothetical protein